MKSVCVRLWPLMLIVLMAFAGCGENSSNPCVDCEDGGTDGDGNTGPTPCVNDFDCEAPETCQDDGFCEFVIGPKPNKNRLSGSFDIFVNPGTSTPDGDCRVTGMIDGISVYLEFGYAVFDQNADPFHTTLFFYGPLTNDLYRFVTIEVPREVSLGTPVEFKTGGLASGIVQRILFDEDFNVEQEIGEAEAIDGQIIFDKFGINDEDNLEGNFLMDLRPVE